MSAPWSVGPAGGELSQFSRPGPTVEVPFDKPNAKDRAPLDRLRVETEWLTANEAAQYLKVKPRTLLQWARERKIPAHRLSGVRRCVWRFRKHELDAILCSSSADPAEGRQQ